MSTNNTARELTEAELVDREYQKQCQAVFRSLRSIDTPVVVGQIISTPIEGYVFFDHHGDLAMVEKDYVFHGVIELKAARHPHLAETMNLSRDRKKALADAMELWCQRPVYNTSQSRF